MLDCARGKKEFKILDCINDHEEIKQKFVRALTTLRKVSDLLRYEMEDYTDEEILVVKKICEKLGENWTIDFPHLNITPKGHDLIFVIPKALAKWKRRGSLSMQSLMISKEKYGASGVQGIGCGHI